MSNVIQFPARSDQEIARTRIVTELAGYDDALIQDCIAESNRLIFNGRGWESASRSVISRAKNGCPIARRA